MTGEPIDYRDLLGRYIAHVGECEGVSFIGRIYWHRSEVGFTDAEKAELEALDSGES